MLQFISEIKLIEFHKSHGKIATLTAVQPEGRLGALDILNGEVRRFVEKPPGDGAWVNGGFFVLNKEVFDYIENETDSIFEQEPLKNLAKDGEIYTYKHKGFWMPMDTLRDNQKLNKLWKENKAPWKIWD